MANQLQEQFSTIWNKTSKQKRITIIALVLASIVIVAVLLGWANTPSYSVAYSGLSDEDAGQIVQKMDEQAISYQVKSGGTILVPADQVYEVRLSMASEGLPKSSTVGYELFSGNMLGMTEFTQKVNYQRALEGELERTIGSLDAVETVRVHVVTPEKSLLSSDQSPTTASVIIKEKAGGYLDAGQVKAITNLVAFSVEGLLPENVAIVDANSNQLVSSVGNDQENMVTQSDSQRAAESAAAIEIQNKVQSMLDSILGPDRATVKANVVMDWSQKEVTSNLYDPTQTALRSSQKITEGYGGTSEQTGGEPGAASNLPTPVATIVSSNGSGNYNHLEETYNYEISQTQTHEIYSPGQIKNISLAVMVDQVSDNSQLEMIKSAVIAAAGIDLNRGDSIAVNTIAFDRTYLDEQNALFEEDEKKEFYTKIGIGIGAGILLLILFGYVAKMMKNLRLASKAAWKPILMPVSVASMRQEMVNGMEREVHIPNNEEMSMPTPESPKITEAKEINTHTSPPPKVTQEDDQRSRIITRLTEENPATVAEIIQIWLAEDEKNRG